MEHDSDTAVEPASLVVEQLAGFGKSRVAQIVAQLTESVAPVLEPVWAFVQSREQGIGYFRQLGAKSAGRDVAEGNQQIVIENIEVLEGLAGRLTAPPMRQVWAALACPSEAYIKSIVSPLPTVEAIEQSASLIPTVRPVLAGLGGTWGDEHQVVPILRRIFRQWCDMARCAVGERAEVARLALAAALLARGAALDGDIDTVRWFIERWLGHHPTITRVDGTSAALLERGWATDVDHRFSAVRDAVTQLRIQSLYQHRTHRPIWETRLNQQSVTLLSTGDSQDFNRSDDLASLAANDTGFLQVESDLIKPRLAALINRLDERERIIVTLIFYENLTPAEVAQVLGISKSYAYKLLHRAEVRMRHLAGSEEIGPGYF